MTKAVHQLKVTLREVRPPVWRRIVVESDHTLGELAPVLEAAMGWLGGHLPVSPAECAPAAWCCDRGYRPR